MALEQDIANMVSSADALTQEVTGKMGAIDARVAAKEAEVDEYVASAKNMAPFFRASRNQNLRQQTAGAGTLPNGFVHNGGLTYNELFRIGDGSIESNNFLADIGMNIVLPLPAALAPACMKITRPANSASGTKFFLGSYGERATSMSVGLYIRVNAGDVVSFAGSQLPADGVWRLVGKNITNGWQGAYSNISINSLQCDFDILMPAVIHGNYNFTAQNKWWLFPRPSINGGVAYDE